MDPTGKDCARYPEVKKPYFAANSTVYLLLTRKNHLYLGILSPNKIVNKIVTFGIKISYESYLHVIIER